MHKVQTYKRMALALLLVALLSLLSLSSALADEDKSVKEKITQLEAMIDDLESIVKSLTLQVQRVSEGVVSDLESFRPRLFTVEKLLKDNTFEIRKLSGTVAQLTESVQVLSELPEQVAYLKASVAELNAQLAESVQALSHRIGSNELALSKLQESVERALIVTEDFKANLGTLFTRLDGVEGKLAGLQEHSGILQTGLERLAAQLDSGIGTLAVRLEELEARLGGLRDALAQVESLKQMFSQLQVNQAELAARQEKTEAQLAQLRDRLQQLTIKKKEEPGLQELQAKVERLTNKIAAVLIEVEQSRMAISELEQSLAGMKEEIKGEVLAALPPLPRVPSAEEIRLQVEEIAAQQLKRAQARADAAQGLAIVALLAGMAAIAVSLLL
jgi:chromosome segregation ATPase